MLAFYLDYNICLHKAGIHQPGNQIFKSQTDQPPRVNNMAFMTTDKNPCQITRQTRINKNQVKE